MKVRILPPYRPGHVAAFSVPAGAVCVVADGKVPSVTYVRQHGGDSGPRGTSPFLVIDGATAEVGKTVWLPSDRKMLVPEKCVVTQ